MMMMTSGMRTQIQNSTGTPDEGRRIHQPKHCDNDKTKNEVIYPANVNNVNNFMFIISISTYTLSYNCDVIYMNIN